MRVFAAVCWPMLANFTLVYSAAAGSAASSDCGITLRGDQVGEPRRMRVALQPDDLALVGVEELLPQPGRARVRGGRVDRLA